MKITLQMSVSKLLEDFEREFGVVLGIYKGARHSNDIKLLEISDPRKNSGAYIVVNKDTSVESLEAMFKEHFGIRVQIKDLEGNTVSQDITLGGVRKLDKGYDEKRNFDIDVSEDTKKEDEEKETPVHKKEKKKYFLNNKKTIEYTVEDRVKEIDRNYIYFQKSERYGDMVRLLSSIEEARLAYPISKELKEHIEDIQNKSYNISSLSVKKRKFAVMILGVISLLFLMIGVIWFSLGLYSKMKLDRELDGIVKEIDGLRLRKGALIEKGNIAEANALEESIYSKTKRLDNLQISEGGLKINYFLIAGIFIGSIVVFLVIRLNKYNVTSVRFKKET